MSEEHTPAGWLTDLPEPLRNAPFLAKADSPEDAVGKLAHAAKLVGTSIRIPGEDASDDDRSAFYAKLAQVEGVAQLPLSDDEEGLSALLTKLGKPNEYTEYTLPELEGFTWDDTAGTELRKYALEAGMTQAQFAKLAGGIGEQQKTSEMTAQQAIEDSQRELRQDWGDTLETREELIRGWLDKSDAPQDIIELLNERELPLDTMKWLHELANQFKGDVNPISRDGTNNEPSATPEEARETIPRILGDMLSMRDSDPRYRDLQKKLLAMQKLANPDRAA